MESTIPYLDLMAIRRLMFFNVPEAAAMFGGTDERTWASWEAGEQPLPESVAIDFAAVFDWYKGSLQRMRQCILANPDKLMVSLWYDTLDDWLSLDVHDPVFWRPVQAVTAAVLGEFTDQLKVIKFNLPHYAEWLCGRQDTQESRGVWSSGLAEKYLR